MGSKGWLGNPPYFSFLVWDVLFLLVIYLVIVILVVTCSHARADFCFFVFKNLSSSRIF